MCNKNHNDHLVSSLNLLSEDCKYMIRYNSTSTPTKEWYFSDIDTAILPHAIMWTRSLKEAYTFDREEDTEEFARDFLIPRDVTIIRVKKREQK